MIAREMTKVVAAVIQRDGQVLVAQRNSGYLAGKWEFPGGKVRPSESAEGALIREIQEEFGASIAVGKRIAEVPFSVESKRFLLIGFYARHIAGAYVPKDHSRICWTEPSKLLALDLSPADVPIALRVARDVSEASPLTGSLTGGNSEI